MGSIWEKNLSWAIELNNIYFYFILLNFNYFIASSSFISKGNGWPSLSIIPWSYNLLSIFESINRSILSNSNWSILDLRVSIISSFFVFICFNSSRSCLSFSISKYFLFLLPCKMLENLPFSSISLWAIGNTYLTTFLNFWINYKTQEPPPSSF